ncbi:hypothetical protein QA802_40830 [Streptomyces sp. B21-105]|uniref:hypothetical protein n=1 Tax=Streptomyces sp. B21-105 TaxID=3039417 RepID=UPI002FEF66B3
MVVPRPATSPGGPPSRGDWRPHGRDQLGTAAHEVLFEATVDSLRRVFAVPDDVAGITEGLVRHWRTPEGEYGEEWERASEVRKSIEAFHSPDGGAIVIVRFVGGPL